MGTTNFDTVKAASGILDTLAVAGHTVDEDTLAMDGLTATAAELNQVADGVGVSVTAANLTELTDGSVSDLHDHDIVPTMVMLDVINKTGVSIAVDKLVAVSGLDATSGKPKIVLADADVATYDDVWVTTAVIADSAQGTVVKGALSVANLNTNSITTAGDPVYLSTTAGAFAVTAPTGATARVHPVGFVVVKSATVGRILWLVGPVRTIGTNEIQALAVTAALLAADAVTTAKILDGNVTSAKLANGAGLASLITAGGGASVSYTKTATGTNDLLANAVGARTVLIVVTVDETFADGIGTQTAFTIGEESGSATKFAAASAFVDKAAGSILTFAGNLTSAKKLRVYATAAIGVGTGGISATVLALPASA